MTPLIASIRSSGLAIGIASDPRGFILVCVLILVALAAWALWKVLRPAPYVDTSLIALERQIEDRRRDVAVATKRSEFNKAQRALTEAIRVRGAYLDDLTADA